MQNDGSQWYWFILPTDRSFNELCNVTDKNFVCKVCLKNRFDFITLQLQPSRYRVCRSSINRIWSEELLHGAYVTRTATDELSCLTFT